MTFSADILEKITQTAYLSAEHYVSYRSIMRLFYREYQEMRYQLDKDTLLSLLRDEDYGWTAGTEGVQASTLRKYLRVCPVTRQKEENDTSHLPLWRRSAAQNGRPG